MENITITNCPTCNSECKVEGGTTHYYVPVKKYTKEDMRECWNTLMIAHALNKPIFFEDYINSLNEKDKT
jgi:hypothetical protein